VHRVDKDVLEQSPIKGEIRIFTVKIGFAPTHLKINQSEGVILIYGDKGCLIANIPSSSENRQYRATDELRDQPIKA